MVEQHSKAQCHTVQVTVSLHSGPCVCVGVCAERTRARTVQDKALQLIAKPPTHKPDTARRDRRQSGRGLMSARSLLSSGCAAWDRRRVRVTVTVPVPVPVPVTMTIQAARYRVRISADIMLTV